MTSALIGLKNAMAAYPSPQAGGYGVPSSRVELHISCKKLRDADAFSKSDPVVAVYTYSKPGNSWSEVRGRGRRLGGGREDS